MVSLTVSARRDINITLPTSSFVTTVRRRRYRIFLPAYETQSCIYTRNRLYLFHIFWLKSLHFQDWAFSEISDPSAKKDRDKRTSGLVRP